MRISGSIDERVLFSAIISQLHPMVHVNDRECSHERTQYGTLAQSEMMPRTAILNTKSVSLGRSLPPNWPDNKKLDGGSRSTYFHLLPTLRVSSQSDSRTPQSTFDGNDIVKRNMTIQPSAYPIECARSLVRTSMPNSVLRPVLRLDVSAIRKSSRVVAKGPPTYNGIIDK